MSRNFFMAAAGAIPAASRKRSAEPDLDALRQLAAEPDEGLVAARTARDDLQRQLVDLTQRLVDIQAPRHAEHRLDLNFTERRLVEDVQIGIEAVQPRLKEAEAAVVREALRVEAERRPHFERTLKLAIEAFDARLAVAAEASEHIRAVLQQQHDATPREVPNRAHFAATPAAELPFWRDFTGSESRLAS